MAHVGPCRAQKAPSHMFAAGLLAAAALGIAAAGFGGVAYAEEPACLYTVGETVEEVGFLNLLLGDTGAALEQEVNFVLGIVHDPIGAVDDEIDTVHEDLDGVQACLD